MCVCVCIVLWAIMAIKATIIKVLFAKIYVNVAESNRGPSAYQPNALLNTKRFKRTLNNYDTDTQYANIWEIPFVKPQNDI